MLVVVSPAKNLDFSSSLPPFLSGSSSKGFAIDEPALIKNVKELVAVAKKLSPADLSSMMKISDKLAILNAERFSSFEFPFTLENSRPAMYAFNGDVYTGLDAKSLDEKAVTFAQSHLRILSGLYGMLKPLDLMQPYRLEMGIKLKVDDKTTLYQYWSDTITAELNNSLKAQGDKVLVNLASNEYFSSVKPKLLDATIVTPTFKDEKNGKFKIISFYAKKARGLMARYIIDQQIDSIEGLKAFDADGYQYNAAESSAENLVFKRAER